MIIIKFVYSRLVSEEECKAIISVARSRRHCEYGNELMARNGSL